MSYRPSAYLYIYFRSFKEAKLRLARLFEILQQWNTGIIEVTSDEKNNSKEFYKQLSITNVGHHESWDVFINENSINMVIDYEFVNLKTKGTLCFESQKQVILSLLRESYIDVAKVYMPCSSDNLIPSFIKSHEVFYFGRNHILLFCLVQSSYIQSREKIRKYQNKLNELLSKYWDSFILNEKIVKVNVRDKNYYLKNNESDLLLDLFDIVKR